MRITNNMLSQNLLRNLEAAQGRMDTLQNQLSSNQRITKPSDDPVGIGNALRIKSSITNVEQWKSSADEALTYMNTADSTLGDITSMLQRASELAIQGANGSLSSDDKAKVANEIDQINLQLQMMANTKVGSKYLFGGTASSTAPYVPGTPGTWNGPNDQLEFEVGTKVKISVQAQTLFGGKDANGDTAVFNTLNNLSKVLRGDPTAPAGYTTDTAIGELSTETDVVLAQRADLGARVNRMQTLRDQLDSTSVNLQKNLSSIMDTDMAKTIVDFNQQQNTYRAALSVGAQIIQPSLVDFMK